MGGRGHSGAVALALCGLFACSSSHPSADADVQDTGMVDSSARDTSVNDTSPPDTGGRDTGAMDTGSPDTGPLDPGWVPMPGLPEGCVIERAEHPERVFTPEWRTEPSCGPGCEYLAPPPPGLMRAHDSRVAWYADGRGYFQSIQGMAGGRETFILSPTDGPAIAAWREPRASDLSCRVMVAGYGSGDAAFVIHTFGGAPPRREYIYRAPLAEIGQATTPLHVLDEQDIVPGSSNSTAALLVSPRWVVAVMTPGNYYLFLDADTRRKVGGSDAPVRAGPGFALLGDEDLYWEDWSAGVRLAHGDSLGHESVFLSRLPEAETISSSFSPTRLSWVQAYDRLPGSAGWSRYELWTAAWPADGNPVAGHKVTDLPIGSTLGVGSEHVYAQLMSNTDGSNRRIELWDLADGRHRVFDPPGGAPFVGWSVQEAPSAISDREMLVSAGSFDLGSHGARTLSRVQLDALPTVTP